MNDHVWKRDHPDLVTGKLSDTAGVAVVAAIAAALFGRTRGLILTGVGFALLKTVPGVAELAAPLRGGVTRRDPFDLIALLALVPVWWKLDDRPARRLGPRRTAPGADATPSATARTGKIRHHPTATPQQRPSGEGPLPTPLGPVEDCNATECFRLVDGRLIERAPAGMEQWRDEFVLSDNDADAIDTGCSGGTKGVLTSVAAFDSPGGAVASLRAAGVVTRAGDGSWTRHRVLDADVGDEPSPLTAPVFWIVLAAAPLGMAAAWVLGRSGTALRILGTVAVAAGVLVIVGGTFTFGLVLGDNVVFGRVQIVLAATAVIIGLGLSALSRSSSTPARPFEPDRRP